MKLKVYFCFFVSFTAKIPIARSAQTLKVYYVSFCICDLLFENLAFIESIFLKHMYAHSRFMSMYDKTNTTL